MTNAAAGIFLSQTVNYVKNRSNIIETAQRKSIDKNDCASFVAVRHVLFSIKI